jgi:UDP-glucuronate 4-epimerase
MAVLVTGAAGFIGYHVCEALLARGESVAGVDNLNDYYDVGLKEARRARLQAHAMYNHLRVDIADREAFGRATAGLDGIDRVVHLAAQAGVRHSLKDPFAYVRNNILGQLVILEYGRHLPGLRHLVYASSSSVYGGSAELPLAVADRVDRPISLYAATKKADELMAHSYSHLYRMPQTGLRFFTVYGPWGRPDMALYLFSDAIIAGRPIHVFNNGDMLRDFTYIDDIVSGTLAALDRPPADDGTSAPHALYNLGNNHPEPLMRLIGLLEDALGQKAETIFEPLQPGDVAETYADIESARRDLGFAPATPIEVGVPRFVEWYRSYNG